MRHVHRTHRVNLDWLYEAFSSNNSQCRLRYVSTKHKIADIHIQAISKGDIWTHIIKLAELIDIAPAGSNIKAGLNLIQTKPFLLNVRHRIKMSASNALHGFAATTGGPVGSTHPHAVCKFACSDCKLV